MTMMMLLVMVMMKKKKMMMMMIMKTELDLEIGGEWLGMRRRRL